MPAGLDAPCARRLQELAVGMEECSRRRSNQRMDLEENEEAGLRSRRDCACVRFARVRFVGSLNVGHPMSWWNSLDPTCPHICASQRIMPAHSLASLNPAQVGSFSQASRQALRFPTLIGTIGAYDCCRPFPATSGLPWRQVLHVEGLFASRGTPSFPSGPGSLWVGLSRTLLVRDRQLSWVHGKSF